MLKLEPRHKRAQGPTNIKMKQVAQTKWDVYRFNLGMTQLLNFGSFIKSILKIEVAIDLF